MRIFLSFMLAGILLTFAGTALSAGKQASPGQSQATAIFAGGCFWCVEEAFDAVGGVLETTSGYTGGTVADPTYRQVAGGGTKHAEAVRLRYDPSKVTYAQLLDTFWHNVNPLDGGGQFCDRGDSYRSAIFVMGAAQKKAAETSKDAVEKKLGRTVVTEIVTAAPFYAAEEGHQDYYLKNPVRYKFYKWNCGRAQRLEEIWGPAAK
jgi:peptide-methionine (S)-S-oxide reductase